MVLCASNKDHTIVKLLEPPQDSKIGERVKFHGFNGDPVSSSVMSKKKVLEKLSPGVYNI
jgi:hypothetical protein